MHIPTKVVPEREARGRTKARKDDERRVLRLRHSPYKQGISRSLYSNDRESYTREASHPTGCKQMRTPPHLINRLIASNACV